MGRCQGWAHQKQQSQIGSDARSCRFTWPQQWKRFRLGSLLGYWLREELGFGLRFSRSALPISTGPFYICHCSWPRNYGLRYPCIIVRYLLSLRKDLTGLKPANGYQAPRCPYPGSTNCSAPLYGASVYGLRNPVVRTQVSTSCAGWRMPLRALNVAFVNATLCTPAAIKPLWRWMLLGYKSSALSPSLRMHAGMQSMFSQSMFSSLQTLSQILPDRKIVAYWCHPAPAARHRLTREW